MRYNIKKVSNNKILILEKRKFLLLRIFSLLWKVFKLLFFMKYQFIFNEPKQSINLKKYRKTVSTIRIPVWLDCAIAKAIKRHKNLEKYLGLLLKRYRVLFYGNFFQPSKSPKTKYQKRGEKYVTHKFRPENRDWLELKMWADSLGVSACFMFVQLLEIDEKNEFFANSKLFRYFSFVVTTPFYGRVPQLRKNLRKGRSILERWITFYDPPEPIHESPT